MGRGRTEDILWIQRDGKERGKAGDKETGNGKEQKKEKEKKDEMCYGQLSFMCFWR